MFKFKGFRASLQFNSTKNVAKGKYEIADGVTAVTTNMNGAYRRKREQFYGYGSLPDPPKHITPSMVVLPPSNDNKVYKSTGDLTVDVPLNTGRRDNISYDPRGLDDGQVVLRKQEQPPTKPQRGKPKLCIKKDDKKKNISKSTPNIATSRDENPVAPPRPKRDDKEAKKREKEMLKQQKQLEREQAKQDKLHKEREKNFLQKQERIRKEREREIAKKEAKERKKAPTAPPPAPQNANPLARNAQNVQTENVEQRQALDSKQSSSRISSISKSSGPPPYSEVAMSLPQSSTDQTDSNNGNVSYGKPIDNSGSSWDMISQHRQQITVNKPATAGGRKQMVMDLNYNFEESNENKVNSEA